MNNFDTKCNKLLSLLNESTLDSIFKERYNRYILNGINIGSFDITSNYNLAPATIEARRSIQELEHRKPEELKKFRTALVTLKNMDTLLKGNIPLCGTTSFGIRIAEASSRASSYFEIDFLYLVYEITGEGEEDREWIYAEDVDTEIREKVNSLIKDNRNWVKMGSCGALTWSYDQKFRIDHFRKDE